MAVPARPIDGQPIDPVWGGVVHDAIVARDVQSGSGVLSFTASSISGIVNITFPRAFGSLPNVVLTPMGGPHYTAALTGWPSATGFSVQGRRGDGASQTLSIEFAWLAIGARV